MQETYVLKEPEQLKALGHPLRVRVLEMLGQDGDWQLTNRELAQRLGVDPGHLHFHVRMLLKAGLIELADSEGRGREKPYRSVAKVFRVSPGAARRRRRERPAGRDDRPGAARARPVLARAARSAARSSR